MSESNSLTLAGDFAVARTSKAGKTTYRGALGVITSGNAAERTLMAHAAIGVMIANNNFRGLMREVLRVFPLKSIRNAPGLIFSAGGKTGVDSVQFGEKMADGRWVYEAFDERNPNKNTAHAYARAVRHIASAAIDADKAFKGEKAIYADLLICMLEAEEQRVAQAALAEEPSAEVVDAE